jgi:hypothetical protein
MDWATQKKMKYYILLVVMVLGIIFAIAFPILTREPTCTDKKQNGTETGVDCGGGCPYICKSDIVPLEVEWSRALPSGDRRVNVVAYIKNNNLTYAVPEAKYKFTLYDTKGGIIQTKEGVTSIPANTTLPVFAGPIDIGERSVQSTTFEWVGTFNFSRQSDKTFASYIEVIDTTLETASTTTTLSAKLKNKNRIEHTNVPVVAIIYDKDENAALVSRTVLDSVIGEGETEAVFFWSVPFIGTASKIEIVPIVSDFKN